MLIVASFLCLCILLIIGVAVPLAFGAVLLLIAVFGGHDVSGFMPAGHWKMTSIVLLAIPLFILAGGIMERGRIALPLVNLAELLIGRVRGGLSAAAVIASAIFGSISGSAAATPHLHRLDHDAASAARELSSRHCRGAHRQRLASGPAHSTERFPDPLVPGSRSSQCSSAFCQP